MRLEPLYQIEREQRDRDAEERGEERAQKRFAQKLLSKGMEIEQIAELTELSPEEITKLTNNNE
jgi:predicted transposase/invertase (TIGR01784 family)